jgi:SAM-dependent methyltransferase
MNQPRLVTRKLRIWKRDYLSYRYLWNNIKWAVQKVRGETNNSNPFVLDVGCGNKPYTDLFEGCQYKGMDCTTVNSSPDIIGDASNIPLESNTVDIVFSTQVLEHVPEPQAMLKECYRVLKPGGFLILTCPFYWPLHEEPFDFYRFTKYGLENLLLHTGFSSWDLKADGGSWAQIFLSINLQLRKKYLAPLWVIINIVGELLDKLDYTESSPANYTLIAKKSQNMLTNF